MKAVKGTILLTAVLLSACAGVVTGQVRVTAQVDTSKPIYVGEQFAYHVVIHNDNRPGEVDVSPLAEYHPEKAGQRDLSQSSTIIVNRRRTDKITKRFVMSYNLTAGKAGVIKLPPVKVTIDGKVYQTNPVTAMATKPGSTKKMNIEIGLSTTKCYVGQPVVMTVKWRIWASEASAVGDFRFNVPVLSSGLFFIEDTDESAQSQNRNRRSVNGQPITLFQRQVKRNGVDSVEVFFTKVLIPKKAGRIEIKPASVSVDMAVGPSRRRRNSFFDDFFSSPQDYKRFVVNSRAIALDVLAVPEEGKPKDFSGLVGKYTIGATAAPTEVNVGDPITLKVSVGGSKYLKAVEAPDLGAVAGMAEAFKVSSEKSAAVIENGFKVFTYTIRARKEDVTEIPPIGLNYFDADKGGYATVRTRPIKLTVAATKVVTRADIEGNGFTVFGKSVEAARMGISAHFEGVEALENQRFSPLAALVSPGYAVLWGGPLGVLVLSVFAKVFTHSTPEKAAARRRRSALANAVKAAKATGKHSGSQACQLLAGAMKQYVADKFGRAAKSLTAEDCYRLVAEFTSDVENAGEYKSVIESCEAGTYSGAEVKYEPALVKKVVGLMRTIEKGGR